MKDTMSVKHDHLTLFAILDLDCLQQNRWLLQMLLETS